MEVAMRKLALGMLAAAGVALSIPANAQGAYVGVGPVGVGVGIGPGYYDNGPYGYYDGPAYHSRYVHDDDYAYVRERRHCRIRIVHDGGEVRKIRRCH